MQAFLLRIMDCSIFDPSNIFSRIVYRCKSKLPWSFKCNSFLSTPIRMFGLSQKLLFLILIFGSFSKFLFWAQIRLHFFITIAFFWIQPQYAYDFSTFNLTMCLWCARYNRILSRLWLKYNFRANYSQPPWYKFRNIHSVVFLKIPSYVKIPLQCKVTYYSWAKWDFSESLDLTLNY